MKSGKILLFVVATLAVVVCCTAPAWAYQCTVQNMFSQSEGKVAMTIYYGLNTKSHEFSSINPGDVKTYNNDDWKTKGLCWEKVQISAYDTWAGCSSAAYKSINITGYNCQDITIIIKRSGCSVIIVY